MKYLISFALVLCITTGHAQTKATGKGSAMVSLTKGMYLFIQSQPVQQYEVLGRVKKSGIAWTGKPKEMISIMTRRAKDKYPTCEGLIFDTDDLSLGRAIAIKFK